VTGGGVLEAAGLGVAAATFAGLVTLGVEPPPPQSLAEKISSKPTAIGRVLRAALIRIVIGGRRRERS
jgi:hypothetical protein